ncbi:MAG: hypothetical protein N2C14_04570, partial [Planctomycetales bacterium]
TRYADLDWDGIRDRLPGVKVDEAVGAMLGENLLVKLISRIRKGLQNRPDSEKSLECLNEFAHFPAEWEHARIRAVSGELCEIAWLAKYWNPDDISAGMVFLLEDDQVVDWKYHSLSDDLDMSLEDVDGDGTADVSFLVDLRHWNSDDSDYHSRPGDDRMWLGAYSITADGFRANFPESKQP